MKALIAPITLFSLAFGYEEAAIVLYLRQLGFNPLHAEVLHLEVGREVATLIVLLVVAWLCGRHVAGTAVRSFFVALGVWDIAFYAWLFALSHYPTITSTDVLFLIPVPWFAPVWSAVLFALTFVLAGVFGLHARRAALFVAGAILGLFSFIAQGAGLAREFPLAIFVAAVLLTILGINFQLRQSNRMTEADLSEP